MPGSSTEGVLRRSTLGRNDVLLLSRSGSAAGDPASDSVDRGRVNRSLGVGRIAFEVTGETTVRGDPGKRAFDRSAARDDGEILLIGRLAYDGDGGGLDRSGHSSSRSANRRRRTRIASCWSGSPDLSPPGWVAASSWWRCSRHPRRRRETVTFSCQDHCRERRHPDEAGTQTGDERSGEVLDQ